MFNNIGNKLKNIAGIYTIGGIILCVVVCLILLFSNPLLALIYGILGSLSVWVSGCVIYGIGQAVENTDRLVEKLAPPQPQAIARPMPKRPPWVCVSCDTENMGHVAYCNGCGVSREWSNAKREKQNPAN